MLERLITLFIQGLNEISSSRTARYFIGRNGFVQDTVNVLYTLMYLRARGKSCVILVDDTDYLTTSYSFPVNLCLLLKHSRVWSTKGVVGYDVELYSQCDYPEETVNVNGTDYSAKLLSPDKVENYFKKLNENQADDGKVPIEKAMFLNDTVLNDFSGLVVHDGESVKMVQHEPTGVIPEQVAYFNEVLTPFEMRFVQCYSVQSEEVLSRWLFSGTLSGKDSQK